MALGFFDDPAREPEMSDIAEALSQSAAMWDGLVDHVKSTYPQVTVKWLYSKSGGWTSRLISRKRTVVYLTPCDSHFVVGLVYGQKATDAALASDLPDDIKAIIRSARVYAEGRGIRIEVGSAEIVPHIMDMIRFKMIT